MGWLDRNLPERDESQTSNEDDSRDDGCKNPSGSCSDDGCSNC